MGDLAQPIGDVVRVYLCVAIVAMGCRGFYDGGGESEAAVDALETEVIDGSETRLARLARFHL